MMSRAQRTKVICYLSAAAGDWGGASRVLFTNIRLLDRTRFAPLLLLPSNGPIVPLLDDLGVRYEFWGRPREPNGLFGYAKDIVRSAAFFRRNRVDLLHINHANYWRPAEVLAARMLRIPVVTHYHVVIERPGPFVRFSSLIAAVSQYTADHSEPQRVPKAVIHNSVALNRFDSAVDIRAELGIQPDDVVVSFVGQIRRIKGIDSFIKMSRAIRGDSVKFLIVGECRDPRKFVGSYTKEELLNEIGDDRRIRYVGYRNDVENIYRSSDIIVMPSRWGEPFGLINIEAGAARRPMVSTRDGGIPEIIVDGQNGFLADPDDLDGLIRHTKLLVDNAELRLRMGNTARAMVEEKFTDLPVRKLEEAYTALIDTQRKRTG